MREYKSRLSQIETQKNVKSSIIYICLTILIIILALVFGIPLFSKFINLFSKNTPNTSSTSQILVPPSLFPLPQYTKDQTINVTGTAKPNSTVKIFFGNSSDDTVADDTGNFQAQITLSKGANTIFAKTIDTNNNLSESSNTFTVNYITQVPNLTISVPQNNQTFYGSDQKTVNIQGTTDAGNSVTINDRIAIVDSSGKFTLPYEIGDGDNTLKIISQDPAGNKKEIDLKVTYNP